MYKVINGFYDLQDDNYHYEPGDKYPRQGKRLVKKRAEELAGDKNAAGVPLIEEVKPAK